LAAVGEAQTRAGELESLAAELIAQAQQIQKDIVARLEKSQAFLDKAISFFQSAARISKNGESYNDMGSCQVTFAEIETEKAMIQGEQPDADKLYQYDKAAVDNYREAMRYNPELQKAYVNYCTTLVQKVARNDEDRKRFAEQCLPVLERAIPINPVDPRPYLILGRFLEMLGRTREALDYYQRCLRVAPAFRECAASLEKINQPQGGAPADGESP
jgi:tetratricopeptide (TPR) repeat protein